jgi:protocatechuate 3,4-dioxygenase beta subunit
MSKKIERRKLFKISLGALASAPLLTSAGQAVAEVCAGKTPAQTEGPFYPVDTRTERDWDLTVLNGRTTSALGEKIYIVGRVTDQNCDPVSGAIVEIWQAAASGRYNHPGDTSGLALDPNFQYWGRVLTDDDGRYLFKTIIPGDYPASSTWQRPPHVHYKVQKRGYRELTTQMYFGGNALNDRDLILGGLPAAERSKVIVDMQKPGVNPDTGTSLDLRWGSFDLGIVKLG